MGYKDMKDLNIKSKKCVACENRFFIGKVGEVLDYLCKKHKKEYLEERVKEIKDYLKLTIGI